MTRIEFYVLPDTDPHGRLQTACRLAAKAWQNGLWTFIRCQDEPQCAELDQLLWLFRPERFVPHNRQSEAPDAPIVLGTHEAPAYEQGLMINLAPDIGAHIDRFSRVIEIINQEPRLLALGREHFRHYRQHGYAPERVEL